MQTVMCLFVDFCALFFFQNPLYQQSIQVNTYHHIIIKSSYPYVFIKFLLSKISLEAFIINSKLLTEVLKATIYIFMNLRN